MEERWLIPKKQPSSPCPPSFIYPQPCFSVKGTVSKTLSSRAQVLELQGSSAHPPSPKIARELRWSSHLKDDFLTWSHPSTRKTASVTVSLSELAGWCKQPVWAFCSLIPPLVYILHSFLARSPWHFRTSATPEIVNYYLLEYLSLKWLMWMKWQWKCARRSNSNHGGQDLAKGEFLIKVA